MNRQFRVGVEDITLAVAVAMTAVAAIVLAPLPPVVNAAAGVLAASGSTALGVRFLKGGRA